MSAYNSTTDSCHQSIYNLTVIDPSHEVNEVYWLDHTRAQSLNLSLGVLVRLDVNFYIVGALSKL